MKLFVLASALVVVCRSFAGEALERERFGADVVASYHSGVGFAKAKANVEAINRCKQYSASYIPQRGLHVADQDSDNEHPSQNTACHSHLMLANPELFQTDNNTKIGICLWGLAGLNHQCQRQCWCH